MKVYTENDDDEWHVDTIYGVNQIGSSGMLIRKREVKSSRTEIHTAFSMMEL